MFGVISYGNEGVQRSHTRHFHRSTSFPKNRMYETKHTKIILFRFCRPRSLSMSTLKKKKKKKVSHRKQCQVADYRYICQVFANIESIDNVGGSHLNDVDNRPNPRHHRPPPQLSPYPSLYVYNLCL